MSEVSEAGHGRGNHAVGLKAPGGVGGRRACFATHELASRAVEARKATGTFGGADPRKVIIGALRADGAPARTRIRPHVAVEATELERLAELGLEASGGALAAGGLTVERLVRTGWAHFAGELAGERLLVAGGAIVTRGQEADESLGSPGRTCRAIVHGE